VADSDNDAVAQLRPGQPLGLRWTAAAGRG
jgi:hypothetical protein